MKATRAIERQNIGAATLALLRGHAEKLNRQIKRTGLDLAAVSLEVVREFAKELDSGLGVVRIARFDVEITAPAVESIIRPGFGLVALAQSAIEGEDVQAAEHRIITRLIDDSTDLSAYRSQVLTCDECGTKRRRNTVLVLREIAPGRLFAVGTDCAEKYLPRAASSVNLLEGLVYMEQISGEGDFGSGSAPDLSYDRDALLAVAAIWTLEHPYVKAQEPGSTRDDILSILFGRDKISRALCREYVALKERADAKAIAAEVEAVKAWAGAADFSDYADNLRAALAGGVITPRTFGLVISAPHVYRRGLEQERKAESSAFYGAPGERFGVVRKARKWAEADRAARPVGTVLASQPIETYYGTSYRTAIQLRSGELLVWWASRRAENVGQEVAITARVKKHDTYRGERQTIITRATLEPLTQRSAAA